MYDLRTWRYTYVWWPIGKEVLGKHLFFTIGLRAKGESVSEFRGVPFMSDLIGNVVSRCVQKTVQLADKLS